MRDLIQGIAAKEGKQVRTVPTPWRVVYCALKVAERIGVKLKFRSDSVLSLVYANPEPVFTDIVPLQAFPLNMLDVIAARRDVAL